MTPLGLQFVMLQFIPLCQLSAVSHLHVPVKMVLQQAHVAAAKQKQLGMRWFRWFMCTPVTQTEHSIQACQFYLAGIISMNQPLNESGKIEILVACCTILCSILVSLLGIHIITS